MSCFRLPLTSLLILAATTALAEPVYPPGARIGLTPPEDMRMSKRFTGFEAPAKGAAITLMEMPKEAFAELSKGLTADNLKTQGLTIQNREEITIGGKKAVLLSGEQATSGAVTRKWLLVAEDPTMTAFVVAQAPRGSQSYSDEEIRAVLTSLAIRAPLSIEEQIAALPFRLGVLSGFRPVRAAAGNSLLLTDGPKDVIAASEQPVVIVAQSTAPAPPSNQRDAFARQALLSNQTFKDVVFERSQGFRQKGSDWHEIVARATDAASGTPLVVTQTLRFAPDRYLRMVAVVRADARESTLPRVRALFDSVETN
jgi:hypothetical protein